MTFENPDGTAMKQQFVRYSLRTLLIAVLLVAIVSALMAARWRKASIEKRVTAMCVALGATISRTGEDHGWIVGLHFSNYTNLDDDHLQQLAQLEHLEVLSLNLTEVTGDGLESLTEFPALRELHVNESQLTKEGIQQLKKLDALEKIEFWGASSDDPRVQQILRALPNAERGP